MIFSENCKVKSSLIDREDSLERISSITEKSTFCPKKTFESLEQYLGLVNELSNVSKSDLISVPTRTIGTVTISSNADSKNIQIVRNNVNIYSACESNGNWQISNNLLQSYEVSMILHLPINKEQIFAEFYGRQLSFKLKELFQAQNYPIGQKISLHNARVPYYFYISNRSDSQKIIFLGVDLEEKNLFKSYFYQNQAVFVILNNLPVTHINQLLSNP